MGYGGELRANTAVDILIGPFVDDTDGKTAETGLTIDVELSKLGQALANKSDATAPVHDAAGDIDGYYNCELDTTDTNTEGTLTVVCFAAGALPVRHDFMVLAEAAWDSKYVAKDDGFMDVNIKTVGRADTQETEANNLESACSNYSATRGLTGTAVPAAAADGAGGLAISDAGGLDLDVKLANTNEVTAARMGALTDLIDGGRLDLLVDAIKAKTDLGLLNTTWTDVKAGYIDQAISAAKTLTAAYDAAKTAATQASVDTIDGIVDTLLARIVGTLAAGTHNAQSGDAYSRLGAAGAGLTALGDTRLANLDAAISSRLAAAGYTVPDNTNIGNIYAIVANATYGNAGLRTLLEAVAGYIDSEVAAILAAVDTEIAAIKSKTDLIGASVALEAGGNLAAVKTQTDKLTFTSGTDLDVNVQKVNDAAITGNGSAINPWGPA